MSDCKGRIYKLSIQYYTDKNYNITEKYVFKNMKRMSCPGCIKCGIFDEELGNIDKEKMIIVRKYVDKGLYKMHVINKHRDWESGQIDDWDAELVLVEAGGRGIEVCE